jgi:hypothetical protein
MIREALRHDVAEGQANRAQDVFHLAASKTMKEHPSIGAFLDSQ